MSCVENCVDPEDDEENKKSYVYSSCQYIRVYSKFEIEHCTAQLHQIAKVRVILWPPIDLCAWYISFKEVLFIRMDHPLECFMEKDPTIKYLCCFLTPFPDERLSSSSFSS
jgi:hypothetical protein